MYKARSPCVTIAITEILEALLFAGFRSILNFPRGKGGFLESSSWINVVCAINQAAQRAGLSSISAVLFPSRNMFLSVPSCLRFGRLPPISNLATRPLPEQSDVIEALSAASFRSNIVITSCRGFSLLNVPLSGRWKNVY